jgi:large subunit ribosomal protein L4
LAEKVKAMGLESALVITDAVDQNLYLSARNLENVKVVDVGHADPVSLIRFDKVILTKGAVAKFEEMMK